MPPRPDATAPIVAGKPRRMRRAITLAVLAAAVAPLASAPGAEAGFTGRDANISVRVAWHYWHSLRPARFHRDRYRCAAGAVKIDWRRSLGSAMASADIWGCRERPPEIRLEGPTVKRLNDIWACGVVTHEFGHPLGYEHVHDRDQLMSGAPGRGQHPPGAATWRRAWARCRGALGPA